MPNPPPTWSWNFVPLPAGLKDVRRSARGYARWKDIHQWHPEATDDDKLRVLCARALHLLHGPATMLGTHAIAGQLPPLDFGEGTAAVGTRNFVEAIIDQLLTRVIVLRPPWPVWHPGDPVGGNFQRRQRRIAGFENEYTTAPYHNAYGETTDDTWFELREAWWGLRTPLMRGLIGAMVPQPEHYVRLWLTINRGWGIDEDKIQRFEEYLNAPDAWRYTLLPDTHGILQLQVGNANQILAHDPVPLWGGWPAALTATPPPFRSAYLFTAADVVEPFFQNHFLGFDHWNMQWNYNVPATLAWAYAAMPLEFQLLLFTQRYLPRETIVWEGQTIRKVPRSWHRGPWVNRTLKPSPGWQSNIRRSARFDAINQL